MTRTASILLLAAVPLGLAAQPRPVQVRELPAPQLLADGRFEILLLSHAGAAALDDPLRLGAYLWACRSHFPITPADSASISETRVWAWGGATAADPRNVTLLVGRVPRGELLCGTTPDVRATALARGFRASADTTISYLPAIIEIDVLRGGRPLEEVETQSVETTRLTSAGRIPVPSGSIKLTIPIEALAPDARGRVDDLVVSILGGEMSRPHRMAIPWEILEPIWAQTLQERAARAGIGVSAATPTLESLVGAGYQLAVAGDSAGARTAFTQAMRIEPCVALAPTAAEAARAIVVPLRRPPVRCEASVPRTFVRSLVLPGFGQPGISDRIVIRTAFFVGVVGTLVASQSANREARDLYADYLAVNGMMPATTADQATFLYDSAEERRQAGARLALISVGIWGVSVLESTFREWRLVRHLQRVQGLDPGASGAEVRPFASTGGVGLRLTFGARGPR